MKKKCILTCCVVILVLLPACGDVPPESASGGFSNTYSITFNGTNQYLSATSAGITAYPFVLSAWVKTTAGVAGTIAGLFNASVTNQFFRIIANAGGTVSLTAQNTAARTITSAATVNDGAWHHIVAAFSSATSRTLYIDGVSQGVSTTNVTFTPLASTFALGTSKTSTPSTYFNGKIDEVSLWTKAFSGTEVTDLYNAGVSKDLGGSTGLASWWRLGDASGDDLPGAGMITDETGALQLTASAFAGVSPNADAP